MPGIGDGGDGLLRHPEGASVWCPMQLWVGPVCPGDSHSDGEDDDEGNNEKDEELSFEFLCLVHPAEDEIGFQPKAELVRRITHLKN